jgi:serine/threonine protein kinase
VVAKDRLVELVMKERRLLSRLDNLFIVNLHYAFQTDSHLYMCMDLMGGGDLKYQLVRILLESFLLFVCLFVSFMRRSLREFNFLFYFIVLQGEHNSMPEKVAQFYAAEIILGICYLHESNVLHRDIKPSNIMFDNEGHIRLADLGLASDLDSIGVSLARKTNKRTHFFISNPPPPIATPIVCVILC